MKTRISKTLSSAPFLRRNLLAAAGLCAMATSVQAQTLITGFENPPFANNTVLSGFGGWAGSTGVNATTNLAATTAQAFEGTQSLRAINGSGTYYFATSPNLYSHSATSMSLYLMNPASTFVAGANIARFEIYYHDALDTTPANNSRVVMTLQYGVNLGDAYQVRFTDNGVASTTTRDLLGSASLNLANWTEVNISLDLSGATETISVTVGGFAVDLPVNLAAAANDNSRLSYLRLGTNTGGTGTTYYDYVTVIPEPSMVLLTACGLGLLAIRRKKRID